MTTAAVRCGICAGLIVLSMMLAPVAEGNEGGRELRTAALLKVLSYDRALAKRVKGKLIITILYKKGVARSEDARHALTKVLAAAGARIHGTPIAVNAVAYTADTLVADVKTLGTNVLYVAPGLEAVVQAVHGAAKDNGAITVCESRALVKAGLAVGVFLRDRRARIAVNLKRARALGMSLDASLLSLVEVLVRAPTAKPATRCLLLRGLLITPTVTPLPPRRRLAWRGASPPARDLGRELLRLLRICPGKYT